jgi:hypothetical protein
MPGGRGVIEAARPLTDFVDREDIPLSEFLPAGALAPLDEILVSSAWTSIDDDSFTLAAQFHFQGVGGLNLPGFDQLRLDLGDATGAVGRMVIGPHSSLALEHVGLTLTISSDILSTPTGQPARINSTGSVRFDADGFHFDAFDSASLDWSRVAGSDVELQLTDIRQPATAQDGVIFSIGAARIKLPMVLDTNGNPLVLEGMNLAFGRRGPSGEFQMEGAAIEATLADFHIRIDEAGASLRNGELRAASLTGALNIAPLKAPGAPAEWIDIEIGISAHGLTASLHADDGADLPQLKVQNLFALDLATLRLEAPSGIGEPVLWMSGGLTPKISGVSGDWPTFKFDELGLTAGGRFRLAKGASIATDQPFRVGWQFTTLTVTAFTLERPDDDPNALELRIDAGIELLKGLPAGASVEGLVARWSSPGGVSLRFSGIGFTFGSPNAYAVDVKVSYDERDGGFGGEGHLDVQSLDLRLDVIFDARTRTLGGRPIPTLFLSAESSLIPGGIPIGSTGLSLYGVSGLLAHNLELAVDNTAPADPRRYFNLFMRDPAGFGLGKWRPAIGAEALGLGVVIGTGDDGWALSARGALILQLPDLSILVTATADLLTSRPGLEDETPGKFSALLAVLPASNLMRLDFQARWALDPLFMVEGAGGGEFHFDRPLDWSVWVGKKESPINARMLKLGDWLINADFWLGINDLRSVDIGAKAAFNLHFGGSDLYAEVEGLISGELQLAWSPFQMEGSATLQAAARLGAAGLSLGFSFTSNPVVQLNHPKYFEVPVEACVHFDLGFTSFDICLAHSFSWREDVAPPANAELTDAISFVPRLWTPPPSATGAAIDGVVTYRNPGAQHPHLGAVQPHSEIVLEFPKSVAVDVQSAQVHLNDVASVRPDLVGNLSHWQIRYALTALELVDHTAHTTVDLFGTFSRSTAERIVDGQHASARPPNTSLRLLSSNRYGGPGSIDGGGVEDSPPVDCIESPTIVRRCIELKDLQVGGGYLPNGWLYQWSLGEAPLPRLFRDTGVRLKEGDAFTVFAPPGLQRLTVAWIDCDGDTLPTPLPAEQQADPQADGQGTITLRQPAPIYLRLCWDEAVTTAAGGPLSGWTGPSGKETWNVPAEQRILHPGHDYALTVELQAQGLDPQGRPTGAGRTFRRNYDFSAAGAPDWKGALNAAVKAVYPADGVRPAFRDYDLLVRFRDDFLQALYGLDERALGVRLRDANGILVAGAGGETVHVPAAWRKGPVDVPPAEAWWQKARAGDPANPCEAQPPIPSDGDTVLPVSLSTLPLAPLARYTAELVAIGVGATAPKPVTNVLMQWSFTTSAFHTFADLAAQDTTLPSKALSLVAPGSDTFETLILAFAAPPVAVVSVTRIIPVLAGDALAYLLIEAPEPLDDSSGRLTVTVAGTATILIPNADQTRIIARLVAPQDLAGLGTHLAVTLAWEDAPASAPPEAVRSVLGVSRAEVSNWSVSLEALI